MYTYLVCVYWKCKLTALLVTLIHKNITDDHGYIIHVYLALNLILF